MSGSSWSGGKFIRYRKILHCFRMMWPLWSKYPVALGQLKCIEVAIVI